MKMKFVMVSVAFAVTIGAVAWGMNWVNLGEFLTNSEQSLSQKKNNGNNQEQDRDGDTPEQSECLQMVRSAYRHVSEIGNDEGVTQVRYSISTTASVMGKIATTKADIELLVAKNKLQMTGGPMEVWQDEHVKITLIPNRNLIYVGDTDPRRFKQAQSPLVLALQDSLLGLSQVVQCVEKKGDNGRILKQVSLRFPEKLQTQTRLSDMNITIDPTQQMIRQVRMQYLPESQIKEMEMTIHSIETDFQNNAFHQTVLQQFLDKQGNLLPKYADYKIIDVRTTKNK